MPNYTTEPEREIRDTSNTPDEIPTGLGQRRGGGTNPEKEIDLGRVENKGSDTGTEAGVGSERGGMGRHGVGYTARLGSEGNLTDDDDDELDLDDEDELDEEDEEDEDLELDDLDMDDDEEEDAV